VVQNNSFVWNFIALLKLTGISLNQRIKSPKIRPLWVRLIRSAFLFCILIGFLCVTAIGTVFWHYSRDLPDIQSIHDYHPKQVNRVFSRDGELLALWTDEELIYRTVLPQEEIPDIMRTAVIAAEDAEFYNHQGLDYPGVLRAIFVNLKTGSMSQGFSSITQQVVKNLLLTPERTIRRKVQEVLLAFRLEQRLTKDEILGLYLNEVYFGANRYGVEEASQYYFGKPVSDITLSEAAVLAGLLPSPARYNPFNHPDASLQRRTYVLDQLLRKGFIDDAAHLSAMDTPLALNQNPFPHLGRGRHLTQSVRQILSDTFSDDMLHHGGLQIHTTLSLEHQNAAENALRRALIEYDIRHEHYAPIDHLNPDEVNAFRQRIDLGERIEIDNTYRVVVLNIEDSVVRVGLGPYEQELVLQPLDRINPENLPLHERFNVGDVFEVRTSTNNPIESLSESMSAAQLRLRPSAEGGLISIDPQNREVLAMVGGFSFDQSHFNRAYQARRPTGSAFKPFVYGTALLSRRYTPATLVRDEPTPFQMPNGQLWNPQNSDGEYLGLIPLRTALARSRNVVAVRLLADLGLNQVGQFARAAGIETDLVNNYTAALGSTEMSLIELVNGYTTIASGGWTHQPILISEITDITGQILWETPYEPEIGIEPAVTRVLTDMMTSVVRYGTASSIRTESGRLSVWNTLGGGDNFPIAGKTGTTNEARDAWFVGFIPQLVAGAWIGFDDYAPLGRGEYGGRSALPAWYYYISEIKSSLPDVVQEDEEQGVVYRRIDTESGLLARPNAADSREEIFLEGTEPTRYAPPPEIGFSDDDILFGAPLGLTSQEGSTQ
jgi:penicillin-binding protein 1A